MSSITLFKEFVAQMTDYMSRHNGNYAEIEATLNQLLSLVTGQLSGSWQVPDGLKQIFDRNGIIGVGSFNVTVRNPWVYVGPGAYWDATGNAFISQTGTASFTMYGQSAGEYYMCLDSGGVPVALSSPNNRPILQFYWDGGSVSGVALYSGCAILFSGVDYADMLTSTAMSKVYTKVADRLEYIETLLGKAVQTPASADTINVNFALGGTVRVLLNRPTTTLNFSGAYDGQRIVLELTQDAIGGRGIIFGSETVVGTDLTFPVPLSTDPNKSDELGFIYNGTTGKYRYTSLARGFSS